MLDHNKLDNPVWHCTKESHSSFGLEYEGAQFYNPDYGAFGGFLDSNEAVDALYKYSHLINSFYMLGEMPIPHKSLIVNRELVCYQMILEKPIEFEYEQEILVVQSESQKKEAFSLIDLVQPGYVRSKTIQLGTYFGIYENGKLVATTGERMQMYGYTEVSGVVTHPEHIRKGYAKQLIAKTTSKIFSEDKIPFLHVLTTNTGAISLYEKLGFRIRRKISFWHVKSNE